MMRIPWDIDAVEIIVTKHFALGWMRDWGWDINDLRAAIRCAYKVHKTGRQKFEVHIQKSGFKKIIAVYYDELGALVCITGSQGGKRL